jgi:hypothetical protein
MSAKCQERKSLLSRSDRFSGVMFATRGRNPN